jgi:hypothetical protein
MVLVEAAVLVGLLGVMVYAITSFLLRASDHRSPGPRPPSSLPGTWRVTHYDADGKTHVVLQKISASRSTVLDEHVIATVASDDPEYDDNFLAAMSAARQRQALFEAEEDA